MDNPSEFSSFENAENAIKEHVLTLSDTYATTIQTIQNVLKKGTTQTNVSVDDQRLFQDLHSEGEDHLHNLQQLKKELNQSTQSDHHLLLEVSAEVLSNAIKFLHGVPKKIETTHIHGSSTSTKS